MGPSSVGVGEGCVSVDKQVQSLNGVAQLRELLQELERDLGLEALTRNERDLLYAAERLARTLGEMIRTEDLRSHPLIAAMAQPTFHRTLRSLVTKGYLSPAPHRKTGVYVLKAAV